MTDPRDDIDPAAPAPSDAPSSPTPQPAPRAFESRRKRRGSGPFRTTEDAIREEREEAAVRVPPPVVTGPARPNVITPAFGRYERADFERVESMLASFASRRFGPFVNQILAGFFGAATAEERANAQLRTAGLSFALYGYRDPKGIRLVDMFAQAGLPLDGRQRAALDACLQARLCLVAIDDVHPGKQRLRGKDILRDEPVALIDRNLSQVIKPGDRVLAWQIPWGTKWQPIGVVQRVEARRADVLERGIETLCNGLRAVRRELPERFAPNLFWLVHRVANMPLG